MENKFEQLNSNSNTVPYNMALLFYIGISKIDEKIVEYFTTDQYDKVFDCLKILSAKISIRLKPDERENVEHIKNEIKKIMNQINIINNSNLQRMKINELKDNLNLMYETLLNYMDKYNMIFPYVDYTAGIDKQKKKYKLALEKQDGIQA